MFRLASNKFLTALKKFASSPNSLSLPSVVNFSTRNAEENFVFRDPVRQVFISQSSDLFSNLALEDWLYRYHDYDHKHLLLIWRNDPCMLIGRHLKANGGTIHHDLGSINCTFFTLNSDFLRRRNVDIVCSALKRLSDLNIEVNQNEDIVLKHADESLMDNFDCNHSTVLVDVNHCVLYDNLNMQTIGEETRATQSIRISLRHLKYVDPNFTLKDIEEAVGWEFLRTTIDGHDGGLRTANLQRGFQLIRPDNDWFPGLDRFRNDFQQNHWILTKSSLFKICRRFPLSGHLNDGIASTSKPELKIELEVNQSLIQEVRVHMPFGLFDPDLDLSTVLHGLKFGQDLPQAVYQFMTQRNVPDEKKKFLCLCLNNMVKNIV